MSSRTVAATVLGLALLPAAAGLAAASRFEPAAGCDFRRARWGMAPDEVRGVEAGPPAIVESSLLGWQRTLGGQPCTVTYLFLEDRLCMGVFQFSNTHARLSPYFDDAATFRDELTALHGEPHLEKWRWADDVFANDRALWGEALGFGLVHYELGWAAGQSLVAMRMSGGNAQADIVVLMADLRCFAESRRAFADFFAEKVGLPSPYFR